MLRPGQLLLISLNIMGRAPIPGLAKTRLIPELGARGAAEAQRHLLEWVTDIGQRWCDAAPSRRLRLWCCPDRRHPFYATLAAVEALRDQPMGDLGVRMDHIVHTEGGDGVAVLLMGADAVSVTEELLDQAEAALAAHQAVIAPAVDGGYVLLGLKQRAESLFRGMPWGSDRVFEITRRRLAELEWRWLELDEQWDVDTPENWLRFQSLRHSNRCLADLKREGIGRGQPGN